MFGRNNAPGVAFEMGYYEIRSSSGALRKNDWVSIDDTEIAPDPVGMGWDEVPASNANLLSEAQLSSASIVAVNSSISLGSIFTLGGAQDLQVSYAGPSDVGLLPAFVRYVTEAGDVAGDYNGNGTVDAADYVVWRNGGPLQNEGRTTGVASAEDYLFWRARFGATAGSGSSAAVPEPISLALLLTSFLPAAAVRWRSA